MDDNTAHQLLTSIMEKVADIDKDVDYLRYGKEKKMSDSSALPFMMGANMRGGYDANAMAWNNPFMYLILLALFGNNGWGGWGNNGANAAVLANANSAETTNLLMNAINNAGATSQRDFDRLASNLGVSAQTLSQGLATINTSIAQLAGQNGMSAQQVINAIQSGNAGLMQQMQSCCCENRLSICQQTNTLQQGQWQLGVTMQQQGDMTRALIREQSFEAQIRQLTRENEQLRDAAQTATLTGTINAGDAAILNKLAEIQTSLQNQITAQGYQISALQTKTATAGS